MKVACCMCKKFLGEKDGRGVEGVSHGLCSDCDRALRKKYVLPARKEEEIDVVIN